MLHLQTPEQECVIENYYFYFSTNTYVVGTQKNRLNEMVLLSTQNTCMGPVVLQISRLVEGSTGQIFATSSVIYQMKMWSL